MSNGAGASGRSNDSFPALNDAQARPRLRILAGPGPSYPSCRIAGFIPGTTVTGITSFAAIIRTAEVTTPDQPPKVELVSTYSLPFRTELVYGALEDL